jgi:tetratricopeptide (TPR) repeat protein
MLDWKGAETAYDQALRLEPDFPAALFRRGLMWYNRADDDRAIADFEAALKHAPATWGERPEVERWLAESRRLKAGRKD